MLKCPAFPVAAAVLTLFVRAMACSATDSISIDERPRERPVDFEAEVAPILRQNCLACHHQKKASGGCNLETPESIRGGSDSGALVFPGKGSDSLLLKIAAHQQDPVMPPSDNLVGARALTPRELGLLKQWIDQGAAGQSAQDRPIRWLTPSAAYQPTLAAAVTPDGLFAACSRGSHIDVLHLPSGRRVVSLGDPHLGPVDAAPAHQDLVRSLAFDPSGQVLASGAFREVKIWRRPLARLEGEAAHPAGVVAIAALSGRFAFGTETGGIELRDLKGTRLSGFAAHSQAVSALAWSPNGSALYTAGLDKTLRVWDPATGKSLGSALTPRSTVLSLVLVPGSDWLAAGCEDGSIHVWETRQWHDNQSPAPRIVNAHASAIRALVTGPEAMTWISGSDDGRIRLWKNSLDQPAREWGIGAPVIDMALDGPSGQLAVATEKHVELWGSDGQRRARWSEDPARRSDVMRRESEIAFLKSAIDLARQDLKSYEGLIRIAKVRLEDVTKAEEELAKVQKTRDEKRSALEKIKAEQGKTEAAEKALTEAETAVTVAGTVIERAKAVAERTAIALSEAEQAVVEREAVMKTREAELAVATESLKSSSITARSLAFRSDGQQVIVGTDAGSVFLFDLDGSWAQTLKDAGPPVLAILPGDDERRLIVTAERTSVWRCPVRWTLERTLGGDAAAPIRDRVLGLDFSPDGKSLVTAGGIPSKSGELLRWDAATGELIQNLSGTLDESLVSARFSPTGDRIAAVGGDRLVHVYETSSGKIQQTLAGHTAAINAVSWSGDGKILATAGADRVIKLWSVDQAAPMRTLKGTTYRVGPYLRDVTALAFVGASEQILAASGDGTVRLHRTSSDNDILTYAGTQGYQHTVAATADGRVILAAGRDGRVRVWSGLQPTPRQVFDRGQLVR